MISHVTLDLIAVPPCKAYRLFNYHAATKSNECLPYGSLNYLGESLFALLLVRLSEFSIINIEDVDRIMAACGDFRRWSVRPGWAISYCLVFSLQLLEYIGKGKSIIDVGLAQARQPLSTRSHYFEVEIVDPGEKCYIALGLARKVKKLESKWRLFCL